MNNPSQTSMFVILGPDEKLFIHPATQSASDIIAEIRRRFGRLDSGADEITASVAAMATAHPTMGAQRLAA